MRTGIFAVAAFLMWMVPTAAEARRDTRNGFNFGATVRLLTDTERTHAGEGSDKNTRVKSESQQINPYVGYSFGSFNLGLMLSANSETSESTETSITDQAETERRLDANGRSMSFFGRFLFGRVFYFEGGLGLYQERVTVKTETKRPVADGSFIGENDSYVVSGTGPGYHLAGGLELPMGGGFHFTSAYQVRIVQLRDYNGGSDFGRKRSQTQSRELLFGIAYYDR